MTPRERCLSCNLCMEDETITHDALDCVIYCHLCFGSFWQYYTYICATAVSYRFASFVLHSFCVRWHSQLDLLIGTLSWHILPLDHWILCRWCKCSQSDYTSLSEYFPLYLIWYTYSSKCFNTAWKCCVGWYDYLTSYWCNSSRECQYGFLIASCIQIFRYCYPYWIECICNPYSRIGTLSPISCIEWYYPPLPKPQHTSGNISYIYCNIYSCCSCNTCSPFAARTDVVEQIFLDCLTSSRCTGSDDGYLSDHFCL